MGIDKGKLLAWLAPRAGARAVVVAAIYAGLAERIRRGDFDEEGDPNGEA